MLEAVSPRLGVGPLVDRSAALRQGVEDAPQGRAERRKAPHGVARLGVARLTKGSRSATLLCSGRAGAAYSC